MTTFELPHYPCSHQQIRSLLPLSSLRHRMKIECKFQLEEYERLVTYHVDDIGHLSVVPITPYRLVETIVTEPFNPFCPHCQSDNINFIKSLGHCDEFSIAFLERLANDVLNRIKLYTELDYARNHRYLWSIPSFTDRVCENDDDEELRAWVERESFEEAEVKHTPASKVSIKALARSLIKNNDCTTCAICLEQLYGNKKEGALKVTMPCKHEFHEGCIVEWLHTNHLCPLCRFELPTQIADY